ncbi:DUF3306 domain-containing protein [Roseobacter ponti]|uniref:DUF3306 domain-containing protein n=1 Tax=Roseobacter ponti TaxID=1891787 RepID=A0A858SUS5_9RHOB|nr:DUF3306 domain-containing protein [Roseobacter ponti]QJF51757.1 DUF3306 domain-containing protein [Roseobacter ponti]
MSRHATFWARRKAAVAAEAEAEQGAAEAAALQEAQEDRLAGKNDAEILEELGLPDPEEMAAGDDFSAFMSRQVPEHLRRLALRKLWRSNPVLACVDGLNDYDDDFRAAALSQGPVKTAYQVGKGMLAHIVEVERAKEAAEAEVEVAETAAEHPVMTGETAEPVHAAMTAQDQDGSATAEAGDEDPVGDAAEARPRRMRFSFSEAEA